MERFLESTIPVYVMAAVTVLGILGTWATGIYYRQMINQTENMMNARHSFLLQMKNRFENTYRVNKGINNIPLFVDRQLKGNRFLLISAESAGKASQKAALVCLIFGGAVTMLQQVYGFGTRRVVTSLAITLFCSITGLCMYFLADMQEVQAQLQLHLEEYFTNTLSKRMVRVKEDEKILSRTENRAENRTEAKGDNRADSRAENRADGRRRKNPVAEQFTLDGQERRKEMESAEKRMTDLEEERFTEDDLQYLRQSLERIAAGRERNTGTSGNTGAQGTAGNERKHRFSAKEEKVIDDILREYFV